MPAWTRSTRVDSGCSSTSKAPERTRRTPGSEAGSPRSHPLRRRVWGVGKVLLLMGALGATFLVFFLVSMRMAIRAGQVQVPNLTGLAVERATQALQELELRPRIEAARRPDATVP